MGDAVDVKDITLGDLLAFAKRLKISSLFLIVSVVALALTGAFSAGVASRYLEPELPKFTDQFTENFVDRDILVHLVPAILEEFPDGIETEAEAMASLLWQVKAQDGYASFLSGENSTSVQVTHSEDSFNFEWNQGKSALLKIVRGLGLPDDGSEIRQLNAEMNLTGVAWLPGNNQIVRKLDGGLALVGEE